MKTFILFQFIFIAFTAVVLFSLIKKQKEHVLSTKAFLFWILLWVFALGVVLLPNSTSKIAATFGVGRGVDLIIYCAIAAIFFLISGLHIKLLSQRREITRVTRKLALLEDRINKKG